MTSKLKDAIVAMQAQLRADPATANAMFSADLRQVEGLRSETKYPAVHLDRGRARDPGWHPYRPQSGRAGAWRACDLPGDHLQGRTRAVALGIPLDLVSVKIDGNLDLRGFFAVKEGVRAGFQDIRGTVHLKEQRQRCGPGAAEGNR